MSDHWEEVTWDKEALEKANVSLSWYLDGKVGKLETVHGSGGYGKHLQYNGHHVIGVKSRMGPAFLVPMHGGIWTMCVSLTGLFNLVITI